jgi:hypothetical protein
VDVARKITLRELRVAVGELTPLRRRQFVAAEAALAIFAGAPAVEPKRFRADVDALLDQDAAPRA